MEPTSNPSTSTEVQRVTSPIAHPSRSTDQELPELEESGQFYDEHSHAVKRYFHWESKIIAHATSTASSSEERRAVLRSKQYLWKRTQELQEIVDKVDWVNVYTRVLIPQSIILAIEGVLLNVSDPWAVLSASVIFLAQFIVMLSRWITQFLRILKLTEKLIQKLPASVDRSELHYREEI